ncbi:hypothetical protein T11_14766, partial [Trichinella zimbabwensis]
LLSASDVECRVVLCFRVTWQLGGGHCLSVPTCCVVMAIPLPLPFLISMGSLGILPYISWFLFQLRFAFALPIGFTCFYQIEEKRY